MSPDVADNPTMVTAETVLTVALKLLGIYLLYSAIFQSATLMNAMASLSAALMNRGQLDAHQWTQLVTSLLGTALAAGLAVILIRHGGRAAHWLSIRSDVDWSLATPTQSLYRGSIIFTGVWLLATQLPSSIFLFVWIFSQILPPQENSGSSSPPGYLAVSIVHFIVILVVGVSLIFAARRIGDWLYRLSGADLADPTTAETQ